MSLPQPSSFAIPPEGHAALEVAEVDGITLPVWVRALHWTSLAIVVPAAGACAVLMLHVVLDVGAREFLNDPLPATLEISANWWMVPIVFLALGFAQLRREHIRATVLTELLPDSWQRWADIAAAALLGMLAAAMTYYGWDAALQAREIRETILADRPVPIWPVTFAVPLGCLALVLECIATIYETAVDAKRDSHMEGLI